jgi:uncharacterized glyoxalase superfamily protein PhnB
VKHTLPHAVEARASVVPTVRYRDVPAAIAWLCEAFGFQEHRVVTDNNGSVLYAQLIFGKGMVMVAPIQETAFGKLMVQPDEIGGVETQICYLHVEDAGAHQAQAAAAGADFVLDTKAEARTERGYSCRDPEGHIWNFGTYDPWAAKASPLQQWRQTSRRQPTLLAAALLIGAGVAIYAHQPAREVMGDQVSMLQAKLSAAVEAAPASGPKDVAGSVALAHALGEARDQIAKERVARLAADQHLNELREQLALVRRPTFGQDELMHTQLALNITADKLAQALADKEAAERSLKETHELLAQLRSAKEASDQAAKAAREGAIRKRKARISAVRAAAARRLAARKPFPAPPP